MSDIAYYTAKAHAEATKSAAYKTARATMSLAKDTYTKAKLTYSETIKAINAEHEANMKKAVQDFYGGTIPSIDSTPVATIGSTVIGEYSYLRNMSLSDMTAEEREIRFKQLLDESVEHEDEEID